MSLSVLNTQSNSASARSTVYRYSLFLFGGHAYTHLWMSGSTPSFLNLSNFWFFITLFCMAFYLSGDFIFFSDMFYLGFEHVGRKLRPIIMSPRISVTLAKDGTRIRLSLCCHRGQPHA
jgi:hypothetical protein